MSKKETTAKVTDNLYAKISKGIIPSIVTLYQKADDGSILYGSARAYTNTMSGRKTFAEVPVPLDYSMQMDIDLNTVPYKFIHAYLNTDNI